MIGNISFYRMRGSVASGEYPLLSPGQALTAVKTFADVLYRDGIQASVDLPYFEGMDTVNVAMIGGKYYWVTAYRERTADARQYTFTLDYIGPTSEYRKGDAITASWRRTPTARCPYLRDEVTNGIQQIVETETFDGLTIPPVATDGTYSVRTFIVQVTGTVPSTNYVKQCIFLLGFSDADNRFIDTDIPIDANRRMPNFHYLFTNLTTLTGIPEDAVLDVSISARSPWEWTATPYYQQGSETEYYLSSSDALLNLTQCGGSPTYHMYSVISGGRERNIYGQLFYDDPIQSVGTIGLRDWTGSIVMDIPTAKLDRGVDNCNFYYRASSYSDISGLYFGLQVGDQKILIPEGKLPWLGNTWETYKAYDMAIDRSAMTQAIDYARMQRDTAQTTGVINGIMGGITTGVMSGVLAGGPAGAAMGIASGAVSTATSLWENQRSYELSALQARNSQDLTERRAQSQPQTGYQTGYGAIYAYQNTVTPLSIVATLPKSVTSAYYQAWTGRYGYPAEGIFSETADYGYMQGQIVGGVGGMFSDRTREVFMQGFRFIDPTEGLR